jgi:nickel-dependent lactate racemase
MHYKLAYGKTGHHIDLPDDYHVDMIEPKWTEGLNDPFQAVGQALKNPYNSRPLKEIVHSKDRVGIIFSDITRATPYHILLPALLEELSHIPPEHIIFFCANGTHRLVTKEELINILGSNIVKNHSIVQNIAHDQNLHSYVGTTSSGNRIFLNKKLLECDVKVLTGFIEPHIFAGFSGGGKALMPGMAQLETIKFNHSIAQLSNRNSVWGITDGNRIWEEIMEAAEFVQGLFLLNVAMNRDREIISVFSGDLRTAHKAGCRFVKEAAMVPIEKTYDIVITSNSGFPLDLNIYQSVKGMSAAAQIVRQGGHIIIAAECWDGIPQGSDYESILLSVKTPRGLMNYIISNEQTLKDTWQIYWQAKVQQKAKVHLYTDKLDPSLIRKALLDEVESIPGLVAELVSERGPGTRICIMPEGPLTIPYLNGQNRNP